MKKIKNQESGRSMIEMIGVLAVAGLITAAAFILITSGMATQRRARAADEISTIASEMRQIDLANSGLENYNSDRNDFAKGKELLSTLKLPSTDTPFGSDSYYSVTKDSNNKQFYVHIVDMSDDADCEAMAKRAWSGAVSNSANCDTDNLIFTIKYSKQ